MTNPSASIPYTADLDAVLYRFQPAKLRPNITKDDLARNDWTLRDAVRGVQIFGGIGSGKSSGSGYHLATTFLKNGFGGIVLTGKIDERERWEEYADETGRKNDLIIFSPDTKRYPEYRFNPLEYEHRRSGVGAGETRNIVDLFTALAKMGGRATGESGNLHSGFWERAMRRCIQAAVNLLTLTGKQISVTEIAHIIRHTPMTGEPLERFNTSSLSELADWGKRYKTVDYLRQAFDQVTQSGEESKAQTFDVVKHYLLLEFQSLAPETRSSILEHFYALADPFRTGLLAKHFSGVSSPEVAPEQTFDGKIIVLDFPVKEHLEVGVYAQTIYKKLWQQAVERRPVDKNTRPVFIWVDEAQYFINQDDVMFQTTARSAKACTVFLSQNISNYYANMGGGSSRDLVNSLMGNLSTKILHNNQDHTTNEWAANTIGKDYRGKQTAGDGGVTITKEFQYQFLPKDFSLLKTGGAVNNDIVEAVVMTAGKEWHSSKNYTVSGFKQRHEHDSKHGI